MNKLVLENLANEFRTRELQISLFEPVSIHKALRTTGILCSFRPLDDDISGMAIKIQHEGEQQAHRFMLINTNDIYCKQRFTACHEFYHLLYQQNFSKSVDDSKYSTTKEREERNANIFASFLLLPEAGLKMLAPVEEQRKDRITLGTILKLEQHFRCSRATLLYRLKDLGWISEELINSYIENVKRSASEYGYNTSLYESTGNTEVCGDYNIKARSLFDKGLISRSKYVSLIDDMQLNKEVK
jgi:Zn-dependent peptidase ImmA (M78 family)